MRRQDRVGGQSAPEFAGSQRVQGIGVQHSPAPWGIFAQQGTAYLGGALPQPGADQQDGASVGKPVPQGGSVMRVDAAVGRRAAAAGTALRRAGQHQLHNRLHAGQKDQPGAAAQRPLCAECSRAAVGHAACRSQYAAVASLVAVCPALRQQLLYQL